VQAVTSLGEMENTSSGKRMMETLRSRTVWIVGIFLLLYVGAEVSIGGWIVSYVIKERSGGHSAGYVASGFWAGIALGRLMLHKFNEFVGEKRVVFFYLAGIVALEITIWTVPSLIENAIAVAFVGFLLGPFYPNAMNLSTKLLPRRLASTAVGFIASVAQTGSAIFPFFTGVLAQKYSVNVLQPMVLALCSIMTGFWILVPPIPRRTD